jgi:signal peptidase I
MLSRSRALALFVLVIFSVVFFLRLFVFSLYSVSTGSMENTLIPGDRIIVTGSFLNHSRLGEPKRGDIIIFRDDAGWLDGTPYAGETLNKRVIGIPGDTVIGSEDGTVMVNGTVIEEPYLKSPAETEVPKSLNVFNVTLGKDEFWVMGDNRGNSDDSRYNGPINRGSIVGVALYLAYPFSRFANFS